MVCCVIRLSDGCSLLTLIFVCFSFSFSNNSLTVLIFFCKCSRLESDSRSVFETYKLLVSLIELDVEKWGKHEFLHNTQAGHSINHDKLHWLQRVCNDMCLHSLLAPDNPCNFPCNWSYIQTTMVPSHMPPLDFAHHGVWYTQIH